MYHIRRIQHDFLLRDLLTGQDGLDMSVVEHFDAKARRQSNTFEDILLAYISGMDTFALGLRKALEPKKDGRLDAFVKERYSSYAAGIGKKIVDGEMTLETLADYAEGIKSFDVPSGRQEYLESVVNRVLFR